MLRKFDDVIWEFAGKCFKEAHALYERHLESYAVAKWQAEQDYNSIDATCPYPAGSLEHHGYTVRYNELLAEDIGGD